ncbi:hypothetical protein GMA11_08160 [Granulicatella sp. zg-ZJ]|nr:MULTISPECIES: hypothetical protein [unclassified Granulicatella]MBS4750212.1 hypothetical protein [Carnobacteriaceae bacterium zg-ZUI78]NEW63350.1 hypothetical protein [Granulicatella sp. zg-ZJ]NEW65692.1 hypothetical protein [Granulicatella sp. zg-84]QMI85668.1 hypothetical protein H1220_08265 [Carnobacteriaceae bacterium zg-84]
MALQDKDFIEKQIEQLTNGLSKFIDVEALFDKEKEKKQEETKEDDE